MINIISISLKTASLATLIVLILGVITARMLTKYEFKGKDIIETMILLPMVLPPSVVGYILLVTIGKRGVVGKFLEHTFGINLIFTWYAACLAAAIVSFPLMYQQCKSAFLSIDGTVEDAARSLGANEVQVFFKISLPLALKGIVHGIILTFARALGEFGATLMVSGNIPGKTRNIPIAIYFAVETGDMSTARMLVFIEIIFSFTVVYGVNLWIKKKSSS